MADPTQTAAIPKPQPLSSIPGVSLTPVNQGGDISSSLIAPGQMADRTANATSLLNTWNSATQPQFQADLRGATSNAAALGKLGSGGLRTSLGDLTYNRDLQRNAQANTFYTNALNGSIDDAYKNLGIAQQQQQYQAGRADTAFGQNLATNQFNAGRADTAFNQGLSTRQQEQNEYNDLFGQNLATNQFNAGRSDTAFNQDLASKQLANATQAQQFGQGVTQAQLGDSLTNSAYNRALGAYGVGSSGDPTSTYLGLAGLYGGQASQGASNLSNLIGNTVAKNGATQNQSLLDAILAQYGLGGGSKPPSATSLPTSAIPDSALGL